MSEKQEDYSAYMTFQSNYITAFALFSGFVFTAIILLLTQYPNVTQIQAQSMLFILAVMFDLSLYLMGERLVLLGICVRIAPPLKFLTMPIWLSYALWVLLSMSVVLMFSLWNLFYLAIASAFVSIPLAILNLHNFVKFLKEWHQWTRK